jgi:hypothetical protein
VTNFVTGFLLLYFRIYAFRDRTSLHSLKQGGENPRTLNWSLVALWVETFGRTRALQGPWQANSETGLHSFCAVCFLSVRLQVRVTFFISYFFFLVLRRIPSKGSLLLAAGFIGALKATLGFQSSMHCQFVALVPLMY